MNPIVLRLTMPRLIMSAVLYVLLLTMKYGACPQNSALTDTI